MAFVIALANTKGGVGKSTIAVNLAEAFYRQGLRVLILDHDYRQRTANKWSSKAEQHGRDTALVKMAEHDLPRLVRDMRDTYDVIVIDGPGYLDKATTAMVAASDFVLMPIQPNIVDLWACEELINWIEERQMITGGTPDARFVLSRCNPDERVSRDEVEQIEATGIPVLDSRTVQRVNYARTMATGGTVFDLPEEDKARCEIYSIYREIDDARNQLN